MKQIEVNWEEFKRLYESQSIRTWVDINKAHALIKSPGGPANWRRTIKLMSTLAILGIPSAIVLFFFVKWWIPVLIIITSFLIIKAIRRESVNAVIETSLNDPEFYRGAILSETIKLYLGKDEDPNQN